MHVEAYHRKLKYNKLHGVSNHRLDRLLCEVLSIVRDCEVERRQKLSMSRTTRPYWDIQDRHRETSHLSMEVTLGPPGIFYVSSEVDENAKYLVKEVGTAEREDDGCPGVGCPMKCIECKVCIHAFRCTCPVGRRLFCKHCHIVCYWINSVARNFVDVHVADESELFRSSQSVEESMEDIQKQSREVKKRKLKADIEELLLSVDSINDDTILSRTQDLTASLKTLVKLQTLPTLPVVRNKPANKLMDRQLRFFSTRKRGQNGRKTQRKRK
jgi:hypothetical protein